MNEGTPNPMENVVSQHPVVDESEFGVGDGSYRAAGKREGITQLVDAFYRIMDELPEAQTIRHMHPRDLTVSRTSSRAFSVAG